MTLLVCVVSSKLDDCSEPLENVLKIDTCHTE